MKRRISMEELEARGLPGPAMAVALLIGVVGTMGLIAYGVIVLLRMVL